MSGAGELPLAERDRQRGEERPRLREVLPRAAAAVAPGQRHERHHEREFQGRANGLRKQKVR